MMSYRNEHPRPDFYRKDWIGLNGTWQFAFDEEEKGLREKWYIPGHSFDRTIEVPFCYQSEKSGIHTEKLIDVVWYRRSFTIPDAFAGKRILLRFGAVDYAARVYVNGLFIGEHRGGYTPFAFDITDALKDGENDLCVYVEDRADGRQPRGKQYWKEGWIRCWYVPCTGIWQSVYLEAADALRLEEIHVTPDIDRGTAAVELTVNTAPEPGTFAHLSVSLNGESTAELSVRLAGCHTTAIISMVDPKGIEDIHLWSPKDPALYDLDVRLEKDGRTLDDVRSYFGMRKIEVRNGYILLNNRACYLRMVLDQGYWPDTLITPPSEEAIRSDIEWTLKLGYNGARKHQKIEDPLYYYWADKMGLLVWGELPAAFEYTGQTIRNTAETMTDFIARDYNHPSIISWVPVNESWGITRNYANPAMQSEVRMLYHLCKALDPTRVVSSNDGWETVETDILGLHDYTADGAVLSAHFNDRDRVLNYAADARMCCAEGFVPTGREALMITEYGGIAIDKNGDGWGYNGKAKDEEDFFRRFASQMDGLHRIRKCCGYCYTQLTDVRQEVNGILTPERQPKVDPERFRALNTPPKGDEFADYV